MKTLLLFDIDGTLLRAEDATRRAIARSFRDIFKATQSFDDISFAGRTDPGIFQDVARKLLGRTLPAQELDMVAARYLEFLPGELEHLESYRLMPGVKEVLPLLAARDDVALGLETGNLEAAAYMKLKPGGIDKFFAFGGFGSDSDDRIGLVRIAIERARRRYDGAIPDETIFLIGDSPYDIAAGREIGINTLAVCTGHARRKELLAESPSCLLPDLADIAYFLRCIGL